MRKILPFVITVLLFNSSFAQRSPGDPKHENHYAVENIENADFKIEFNDAHSQQVFTLVKITITNKTSDYLYFKGTDSKFIYDFGTQSPNNSFTNKVDFYVEPMGKETRTLKVTGDTNHHVEHLKLDLNCLYKISVNGEIIKSPDFQLPAAKNSFSTRAFKCDLRKSKQTTKETVAEFECTYIGKEVALVNPSNLSVKLKDGQEFANNNKKESIKMLLPGDDCKFNAVFNIPGKIADMQFTVLYINWNDTFIESVMKNIKLGVSEFSYDAGVTELKNK